MQKKLALSIVLLAAVFQMFFFLHISNSAIDRFLLDKTTISFKFTKYQIDVKEKLEFLNKIKAFSVENNVEIAQYSFLSADKIDIYSTMKEKYDDILFVPDIIFNRDIKVHDFDKILDIGFKNILYVDTNDKDIIKELSETLKDECEIYYMETGFENNDSLWNTFSGDNSKLFLSVFSFFVFIIILIIYFYYSTSKKEYFLYKIWGYTNFEIYYRLNRPVYVPMFFTMLFSSLIMAGSMYGNALSDLTCAILFKMLRLDIVTILVVAALSLLLFLRFDSGIGTRKMRGLKKRMVISCFAKGMALLFIIIMTGQFFSQRTELTEKSESLSSWKNTQNLYNLYESATPYSEDLAKEDIIDTGFYKVYRELSAADKEFIIETSNFERENAAVKKQENIEYAYKVNVKKEEDLYSPYGRNIIVDKNYLKHHAIKSSGGENVVDKIDDNDDVLNILVPQKFQQYENTIRKSFKDWFYFQKVTVTNKYKQARGQEKIRKNIDDLQVNIIYIDNGHKIFTYNPNSGDESNIIKDTIITVYTENVDNSFLAACLGDYIFIESSNEYSVLKEISAITQKYNVIELNTVSSVYDKKGGEIRSVEESMNNLIVNMIMMSLALTLIMIVIIHTYYETCLLEIIIKSLHGYSFWQIYKQFILGNIFINIFVLFFTGIIYRDIALYMVIAVVLTSMMDCFVSKIVSKYLDEKNEIYVIRGA